jgi:hypothetical protein
MVEAVVANGKCLCPNHYDGAITEEHELARR